MSKATAVSGRSPRNVCDGSLQPTGFEAGTKNPCAVCGRLSTTKRDGNQRRHTAKKKKEEN